MARLPILAVVGSEGDLPTVPLVSGEFEVVTVNTILGVKWDRAIGVLAAIWAGQFIFSAVVLFWCRDVFVPDYWSHVSTASLLNIVVGSTKLSGVEAGPELAATLGAEGKALE